ncbi:MAG: DUF1036 domain-containing protein [Rhizobiaceae bacterium]|nr:DUF1036 domain-containing protein [Rhizobiaceae bacterium]MCV0405803.1 DUF1036 domain-containing protein [Rhizobiaceae bacterium]
MILRTKFRHAVPDRGHHELKPAVTTGRTAAEKSHRGTILATWMALIALAGQAAPAAAQFQVCNQTFDVINVAIGQEQARDFGREGVFQTEGWWTIGANRCVDVIKDELVNRYIYVFATDVFDQPIVDGTDEMCIAPKRFVIEGIDQCWQRGHKVARFMEVDTQAVQRWTLFLKDPLSN